MQLARGFFLTPEKRIKRKLIEIVITFQLEHRFTKQQIFEMYANEINLGQRGSFAINGFGEAAQAYFGKDVRQLDLAECALLAGMIQSPTTSIPIAIPSAPSSAATWCSTPWSRPAPSPSSRPSAPRPSRSTLSTASVDASEAPYFVDLVHDQLVQKHRRSGLQPRGSAHLHLARS